jgi:hypothetical protein
MSVLLQIADPHFGTEQPPVVEALVALARQQRPDLLVLSGDVTQRARPAQFRAARAVTDLLGAPMLAVPGNHDIPLFDLWARLRRPYARHIAAFGDDLEPVHSSSDLMVVCVNTTRAWPHKHGEVSAHQIDRVVRLLAGAEPGQLRVVVVHQPVAVTRAEDCRSGAALFPNLDSRKTCFFRQLIESTFKCVPTSSRPDHESSLPIQRHGVHGLAAASPRTLAPHIGIAAAAADAGPPTVGPGADSDPRCPAAFQPPAPPAHLAGLTGPLESCGRPLPVDCRPASRPTHHAHCHPFTKEHCPCAPTLATARKPPHASWHSS